MGSELGVGIALGLGLGSGFRFAINFVWIQVNYNLCSLPATHPKTFISAIKKQASFDQQVELFPTQCANFEQTIVEDEEAINSQLQQLDKL